MKFPYRKFGMFYRPVVPVVLKSGLNSIEYQMLIDTGADVSIAHLRLADGLGLELDAGRKTAVAGIGGKAFGYIADVELIIGGYSFGRVPVSFAEEIASYGFGVLGHEGVFNKCRLVFEFAKKTIEIIPKVYK